MTTRPGVLSHYVAAIGGEAPRHAQHGPRLAAHCVGDVMDQSPVTAHRGASVRQIAQAMDRAGAAAVPVIDESRTVVGVVSVSDLLARVAGHTAPAPRHVGRLHRRRHHRRTPGNIAAELMTTPPIVVTPSTSIADAAHRAALARVRAMPVVDAAGKLVGMVTREDLMHAYLRPDEDVLEEVRVDILRPLALSGEGSIEATVTDGVVTYRGTVASESAHRRVVHDTHQLFGVIDVRDEALDYPPLPSLIYPAS